MAAYWEKIKQYYMVMAKREQYLVVGLVFFLVLAIWYGIVWGVIESSQQGFREKMRRAKQEIQVFNDEMMLQNARLSKDPNKEILAKQAKLESDIKKLELELGTHSKQLLSASSMLTALKELTVTDSGIQMTGVDLLPDEAQEGTEDGDHPLYRHGVKLSFTSDYFATMAYLQKIEALPWRLFWDKLDYQVTTYPKAEVTLTIHTLSDVKDDK